MFHKSQPIIKSDNRGIQIQKVTFRQVRKPKVFRSPANYTKKKFTPRINSSFAEYDECLSPKTRFRSTSVDRPRRSSELGLPSNLISSYDESCGPILAMGKKDLKEGKFEMALEKFSQILAVSENLEALYHRALCNMSLNKAKEAIVDFLNVIKENTIYTKSAFMNLVKCFQMTNDVDAGIRYITQGITKFGRFDEGFLIRAKLYSWKKNWDKARSDYKKYLKYNNQNEEAILGLAECYEKQEDYSSALKVLNESPNTLKILIQKSRVFYFTGHFHSVLQTLDSILIRFPSAEGFFLKAESHNALGQYTESALSYEQCLKYDINNEFQSKAVYNLGALKIRERDFYGALHTFQRCLKKKVREQKVLEIYADAVISLMKREYKVGVKVFNRLIKAKESVVEEYLQHCYCYRAYGYLALGFYDKCIQSLKKAASMSQLDKASLYNLELSNALLLASKLDFDKSNMRLDSAMGIFHRKAEPYIYKASFLIYNAFTLEPIVPAKIKQAEGLIETAVAMRDPDSELLFYRAIIRYLRGHFHESLEDMKQCIEKAEDNISEHYTMRGLCNGSLKSYKEAIQDFTIALQLNEKAYQVYSYRGRCAYMIDDTSLAFSDYQKYVACNQDDYSVHIQAAILLMSAGSYEDSLRALESSLALQYTTKAKYLAAKCWIIQNSIPQAINELKGILKNEEASSARVDMEILEYLSTFTSTIENFDKGSELWDNWQSGHFGEIFELKYILWFKAVFSMFLGKYSNALDDFQIILEILHSKNSKHMTTDETLTSEEENCEVLYNIALCHIFGNKAQSILILEDLSEILNNKHKGQMLLLAAAIYLVCNNTNAAEKLLKEAFRCDSETVSPYLANYPIKLLPLNTNSAFAEKFPLISVDMPGQPRIEVRPAISLPRIHLPSLDFSVQTEVKDFFLFSKIQPKPEAPWLNRVRGSIQFTDAIVDVDTEPTEITEREKKNQVVEESNESKRNIKSMIPLRHFSSDIPKTANKQEKQETPSDIIKKIQELCSKA